VSSTAIVSAESAGSSRATIRSANTNPSASPDQRAQLNNRCARQLEDNREFGIYAEASGPAARHGCDSRSGHDLEALRYHVELTATA
jgi:hypothetical protein